MASHSNPSVPPRCDLYNDTTWQKLYLLLRPLVKHWVYSSGVSVSELRAIRRGEAAIRRGDYITLDEIRREETMARRPRRARSKVA